MSVWTAMRTWIANDELTVARIQAIADNITVSAPVGQITYAVRAATTAETLVADAWLECNGVSVLRADFPDLNTILSALSYPFGSADATHMNLPNLSGRVLVGMAASGHSSVNALGDVETGGTGTGGLTAANRNMNPTVTDTVSISGTTGGTAPGVTSTAVDQSFSHVTVLTGVNSHTHTFSDSDVVSDTVDTPYLVAGVYLIKAIT